MCRALADFLRALGVPSQDIPAEEAKQAARYRSLLAGRRVLIVLDNAGSADQVRQLLPGSPTCAVVVTSRDSLAGLVAREGAERLELDLLPLQDAVGLLRALSGPRAGTDLEAVKALAVHCCRLPLALRIAAELARTRAAMPLSDLAAELDDQQNRLDLLDAGGDTRTAVRAVFSWSSQHLDADAASVFRLLGLHPGPDVDRYAAAALTGTSAQTAGTLLDRLVRAHLIQVTRPGRYGMHDLLRDYAAERAGHEDTELDRRAALARLFDYYLATAAAAMDTLHPAERHRRPRIPAGPVPARPMTGPAAARAWLDAERAALVAAAAHTAALGWPEHTTRLAATLFRYLDTEGHYPEAITIHSYAARAAHQASDYGAEAIALTNLGAISWRTGHYQHAAERLRQSLILYSQVGDRTGQARALGHLGVIDERLGNYSQAADYHQQALALFRETGDQTGEASALCNLGVIDRQLGCYQQAADHNQQALALFRQTGDRDGEAYTLGNLGVINQRLGRYEHAADFFRLALALFRQTGDRYGEAQALTDLAVTDQRQGRYEQAIDNHQQALALFRQTGGLDGEAAALNGLGETLLATGQPDPARASHVAALDVATETGDQYGQARAHDGLALAWHADGDYDRARRHWHEALAHYRKLGVPEAADVLIRLASLNDTPRDDNQN